MGNTSSMCNCLDVDMENEKNKYDSKLIWERQRQAQQAKLERDSARSSYREITNIVNMSQMSNSIRKNKGKQPESRDQVKQSQRKKHSNRQLSTEHKSRAAKTKDNGDEMFAFDD